jgi:sugar diacid utilization regulator
VDFAQAVRNLAETSSGLHLEVQGRVWGMGDYDEQHLDPTELSSLITHNVRWLLLALVDPADEPERLAGWHEVRRIADEIGSRRAVQAISIDAVIRSWRTAERVLVERLVALADEVPAAELLGAVRKLGRLVATLTDRSIEAHRRVQQEVTGHYDRLATDLVARIVSGAGLSRAEIEQRSALIQADPADAYQAVVIAISERDGAAAHLQAQRHLIGHLAPRIAGRVLVGSIDDRPLLLVPTRRVGDAKVRGYVEAAHDSPDAPRPLTLGLSAGSVPLEESRLTARQARLAVDAAERLGRHDDVVVYTDVAVEGLLLQAPETADLLVATVEPLRCRPELLETLRAYLSTGYSARAAAQRLYVHPNTVPHRMRTISRLLDRSLADIERNLDLLLALRWLDLQDDADKPPRSAPDPADA